MARPPKIDSREVLERATLCFWKKGYSATSLDDLEKTVGLKRGSLYFYFKDKKHLYIECMNHYKENVVLIRRKLVENAPSAKEGIFLFFEEIYKINKTHKQFLGCLNTNTASELALLDPEIQGYVQKGIKGWEDFWIQIISKGHKDGSIPESLKKKELAQVLVILTQGSNVVVKSLGKSEETRNAVFYLLNNLLSRQDCPTIL